MKKRLLLYTAYGKIKGNVWSLHEFYKKYLEEHELDLEIIYVDSGGIKNSRIKNKISYIKRNLSLFFPKLLVKGKIDYWVSDSEGNFLSRFGNGVEISHGYGTKMTPSIEELGKLKLKFKENTFLKKLEEFITLSDFERTYYYTKETTKHNALYIPLGLPRNDRLFDENFLKVTKNNFLKKYNLNSDIKLILYAPTWREYKCEMPISNTEIDHLNEELKKINAVILYRPHYCGGTIYREKICKLSNFIYCGNEEINDTQEALVISDYLITDYSSIYVDYLLLNRPICYCNFDYSKYTKERGLVIDLENDKIAPGPKGNNLLYFIPYFNELLLGKDMYEESREEAIRFFHKYPDGNSSKRVWQHILEKLDIDFVIEDELLQEESDSV